MAQCDNCDDLENMIETLEATVQQDCLTIRAAFKLVDEGLQGSLFAASKKMIAAKTLLFDYMQEMEK